MALEAWLRSERSLGIDFFIDVGAALEGETMGGSTDRGAVSLCGALWTEESGEAAAARAVESEREGEMSPR